MRHVAPHRWAEALSDAERTALDRHADACDRCRSARDRVLRGTGSFPAIRAQPAPELPWDSIRARVHWSVSTAKRDRPGSRFAGHDRVRPPAQRGWWIAGIAALAAGGAAAGIVAYARHDTASESATTTVASLAAELPRVPAAQTAVISRLAGDVLVDGVRPGAAADAFAHALGAGTVIATGAGRLDAQFGDASAFALEPRSTLELRRFDAEVIELAVDGAVDVVVAPRAPGQRFLVDAGDRVVEVRGTRFSVRHDASGTTVACQHGLVAVRDAAGAGEVLVGAARKAVVPAGEPSAAAHAVPLSADELDELARTTPWATPGWTADLAARTSPLEISSPAPARAIRVDGIELGAAPFAVRVAPGRHTVEAADAAGRFHRAGWVDVGAGAAKFDAVPLPADDAPGRAVAIASDGVAKRKAQLAAGISSKQLAQCTRALSAQGLTGAYVQIEIAVAASGAVSFLNVLDTDLPQTTSSCVRDALASVPFGAGPAAQWHEKIALTVAE